MVRGRPHQIGGPGKKCCHQHSASRTRWRHRDHGCCRYGIRARCFLRDRAVGGVCESQRGSAAEDIEEDGQELWHEVPETVRDGSHREQQSGPTSSRGVQETTRGSRLARSPADGAEQSHEQQIRWRRGHQHRDEALESACVSGDRSGEWRHRPVCHERIRARRTALRRAYGSHYLAVGFGGRAISCHSDACPARCRDDRCARRDGVEARTGQGAH
mmetsp:Transcript_50790/g.135494  ORF Transcript_50790/g.135494 Transcript_50790/m.135494 type:complete len:216 (+) Transcript_50790:301-948(+)